MPTTRRRVLTGFAAGLGSLAATPLLAERSVGAGTLTTVSDGNLVLPGDFAFSDMPQDELAAVLARFDDVSRDQLTPPCNVTLYRDDERVVLFDVGAGPGFMPTAGALTDNLAAAGVAPEDVTDVLFTHAHPDHLWGLLDDFDDPLFANARYQMGRVEWDYWWNPETVDTIGEARASFAVGAKRRMEAIEDATAFFDDGAEVLPGIEAVATFGHTPGHMAFRIADTLVAGDAISNHHVAFARPSWQSGADQDPDAGAATRVRLLDRIVADDLALVGFHLPSGGTGRVERDGDTYRFVAEAG